MKFAAIATALVTFAALAPVAAPTGEEGWRKCVTQASGSDASLANCDALFGTEWRM